MELDRALDQIAEIHAHLDRTEVSRDYRALPVALGGLAALAAAALQPPLSPRAFVAWWLGVAIVVGACGGAGIAWRYFREPSARARRRTRTVIGQYLPTLAAGAIATAAFAGGAAGPVAWLPGVWALLAALGVFASRPYLPRHIGWDALFYLAGGAFLLALAPNGASLNPWAMGLVFGPGQLLFAAILWNLERNGAGGDVR